MRTLVARAGLAFSILFSWTQVSDAAGLTLYYIGEVSQVEFQALPTYCQKYSTNKTANPPSFYLNPLEMEAIKGISGLHHYCRIPVLRMRYIREQDAYKKDWLLKLIIDEANYVTASSKPDAPLVAAAYLEKARALVDKRQEGKAIAEYHNVLRNNPKDATPYLDLARLFVKLDNRAKALEIVTEGLRHNSSKGLKRYYLELGGKEPYPTPYLERAAPAINALQPQAPLASPKAEPQTPVHSPAEQSLAPPREAPKPPLENPVDEKNSLGKSYCRFCP